MKLSKFKILQHYHRRSFPTLPTSILKIQRVLPETGLKRHSYVQLANAMHFYGNDDKNIEY
ncbi:hypothetical protein BLOT_014801 [Blomia tropicalis]|nr:hypothetical protein BLOT_014801 [Blomia tropicalis]